MSFKINIKRKAQKSLSKIPEPFQTKIIDSIRGLAEDPFPPQGKKLTGRDGWRIRIGDYRAIYEVNNNELIILVLAIDHRKDIYRK